MMPDASRGVPLVCEQQDEDYFHWHAPYAPGDATHVVYPVALASTRERVVEAARRYRAVVNRNMTPEVIREMHDARDALDAALADLDALEVK